MYNGLRSRDSGYRTRIGQGRRDVLPVWPYIEEKGKILARSVDP